ncbi:hypothetical protein [Salipaludibacillus aurantiacus]|uniref:Uncharacterized protein n=1 Tax=Salipaludibacillus aurantiacus TaxID=1601833 RepID=A0A1H9TZX3_9BACI|nr:hypothetical protein [Salipaludibacillus aurantiacus]SES02736.1 hypothetical protein SAMN05518684_106203 [Salipaludibacillus aurantiacus]
MPTLKKDNVVLTVNESQAKELKLRGFKEHKPKVKEQKSKGTK